MAYIVRTHIYRYFKNNVCSLTGCFFVVIYLFAIIAPFLFALSTGEFWQQVYETSEQPQISLSGDYALQCFSGFDNATTSNTVITSSNRADFKYLMLDENQDGRAELITFEVEFDPDPLAEGSFEAESCTLILYSYFGLRQELRLQMIFPILMSFNLPFRQYSVSIEGELGLEQKAALIQTADTRLIYNSTAMLAPYPYNLVDLYAVVSAYNETVVPRVVEFTQLKPVNDWVVISGKLRVPIFQEVHYRPTVMISFKQIWIQYIFLAIPLYYLIEKLGLFTLKRKIFFAHQQVYNDEYKF